MLERARTICIVRVSLSEVNMVSDIIILAVYASSYRNVIFNNNEYSKRILILRWTYLSCEPRHKSIFRSPKIKSGSLGSNTIWKFSSLSRNSLLSMEGDLYDKSILTKEIYMIRAYWLSFRKYLCGYFNFLRKILLLLYALFKFFGL